MALTNISIKSLNMLEKGVDECKKTILQEIHEKYLKDKKIPLEDFIKEFMEKPNKTRKIIVKRKLLELDELDRCEAKIWYHNKQIYGRCKLRKLDIGGYCKKHHEKRNYGDWEETI